MKKNKKIVVNVNLQYPVPMRLLTIDGTRIEDDGEFYILSMDYKLVTILKKEKFLELKLLYETKQIDVYEIYMK